MSGAMKKKPGFMVALALKPKGKPDDEEPEGFDDDEDEIEDDDAGEDEDDGALADAGTKIADELGLKPKDPAAFARSLLELMDLHREMKDAEV